MERNHCINCFTSFVKYPESSWIRILYCYPEEIYDELIQTIKEENKVCHYLDLPIQHASDADSKTNGKKNLKSTACRDD